LQSRTSSRFSFGARDRLLDEFSIVADDAGRVSSAMELSRCVIRYLTRNGVGMRRRFDVKPGRRTNFSILNAQYSKDGRITFIARPFDQPQDRCRWLEFLVPPPSAPFQLLAHVIARAKSMFDDEHSASHSQR
jgi:hypothetical protein